MLQLHVMPTWHRCDVAHGSAAFLIKYSLKVIVADRASMASPYIYPQWQHPIAENLRRSRQSRPTENPAMKFHFAAGTLLLSVLLAAAPCHAQAPSPEPGAPRAITIVVVDELVRSPQLVNGYELIASVFTDVFERRKPPYKVTVERFASNTSDTGTQLRIFFQGIYKDTPDAVTFHAWMTFNHDGEKKDFGIIRFRYSPHPIQQRQDVLEHVIRGAAIEAAEKIDLALASPPEAKKP
jgi:hypothetical protein